MHRPLLCALMFAASTMTLSGCNKVEQAQDFARSTSVYTDFAKTLRATDGAFSRLTPVFQKAVTDPQAATQAIAELRGQLDALEKAVADIPAKSVDVQASKAARGLIEGRRAALKGFESGLQGASDPGSIGQAIGRFVTEWNATTGPFLQTLPKEFNALLGRAE